MNDFFAPACPIFISHTWSDGTGEFVGRLKAAIEEQTLVSVWVDMQGIDQVKRVIPLRIRGLFLLSSPYLVTFCQFVDDVVQRFRSAICAANVIIICLTPSYLTRPNCLRELRWSLDFASRGMKRVVLLPLHPAVTFSGVTRMTQSDALRGLVYSSREKSAMNISCAALDLLTHVKFKSQMTQLPCHELQVPRESPASFCSLVCQFTDLRCRPGRATP